MEFKEKYIKQMGGLSPTRSFTGEIPIAALVNVDGRVVKVSSCGSVYIPDSRGKESPTSPGSDLAPYDQSDLSFVDSEFEAHLGSFRENPENSPYRSEEELFKQWELNKEEAREDLIDIGGGTKINYLQHRKLMEACDHLVTPRRITNAKGYEEYVVINTRCDTNIEPSEVYGEVTTDKVIVNRSLKVINLVAAAFFPYCDLSPKPNFQVTRIPGTGHTSSGVEDLLVILKDHPIPVHALGSPLLYKPTKGGWVYGLRNRHTFMIRDPLNPSQFFPKEFDHPNFALIDMAARAGEAGILLPAGFTGGNVRASYNRAFLRRQEDPAALPIG